MKKFKPGDEITAVFTHLGERRVRPMRLTKVGTKYLYGIIQYLDSDGNLREGHSTRICIEESTIYRVLRFDIVDAEQQYRKDLQGWKNQREEQRRSIQWELRTMVQNRLDAWEADYPQPKPPEVPAPEEALHG